MNYQDVIEQVRHNSGMYNITLSSNTRVSRRIFVSTDNSVCEFAPRSRKKRLRYLTYGSRELGSIVEIGQDAH